MNLQGLAVVARAAADLALHIDIRQELHLDFDEALPFAVFAAAAADIEAEAAGFIAADLAFGQFGKEMADVVEHFGIGAGVAARRAADGTLVDVDDFVDFVDADDVVMVAGAGAAAVDKLRQTAVQRLDHQ